LLSISTEKRGNELVKKIEKQIEIFKLVLEGDDLSKQRALEWIRKLSAIERRGLRDACQRLDKLVLDIAGERQEKRPK
jgi:hypothetical protein